MKKTPSISQGMFLMLGLLGMCLPARGTTLTYVGVQTIPTGTVVGGVEIGGLSGISYNPYTDRFVAITDDSRSDGASRMWTLDLAYTGAAFSSATAVSSVGLKKPDGSTLPLSDTEGIAGNLDGSFYVSHEGLAAGSDPAYSIPPWISRFNGVTGNKEADVALPVKFLPRDGSGNPVAPSASNQSSGVVSNLSLECLGITHSKKVLFTANEAALKQDYNGTYDSTTNQAQNSLSRIVRFTGAPGNPVAAEEKVYQADQGTLYIFVRRFNTVPEILPVDDSGRMLVMERGLTQNNTNLGSYRIRIYEVNFNQAGTTNVAGVNSLQGASYTKLGKTLLWESSSNMDNVESMCFGRDVNGFRTLVLASDNNFNGAQTTQFHVLTTDIPSVTRRTLATAVTGSGSVTAAPSVAWYPDGSEVSLTAMPGADHTFGNWSGDATGTSNPIGLTMDADKSVTANFQQPTVTNIAYWRGGENDVPLPSGTFGPSNGTTIDFVGGNNLQAWNTTQATPGLSQFGPYYSYPGSTTVIYSQNFTGGAFSLAGTSPTSGGGTWTGGNILDLNGDANPAPGLSGAVSLAFTPVGGYIYDLTATINVTAAANWLGVGFLENNNTYGFYANKPAALRRIEGWEIWPQGAGFSVTGNDVTVRLDTTGAQWTTSFFQGGVQMGSTHTYTTNPTINHVGFVMEGAESGVTGNVSAFRLTSVSVNPEAPVNASRAPGSTVNYSFDPGAGNAFVGEAITTTTTNWGIQCYTNSTQNGQIISNGNVAGIGSGGYGLLVYNNHFSGIMNGVALLEGTISPDGNWHNLALVNDNGTLKLYVDGVLNASSTPGAATAFAPGNQLTIGAGYNANTSSYDGFINGGIDEARIFTFAEGQFLPFLLQNYVPELTYASWSIMYAGGQAADLDYDSDGVANGIEYFMNAAPGFSANPGLDGTNKLTWPNGGNIPSSAYGTQFVVQTSNDLASWTDVPITDANLTNTPGLVSYTLTGGPDRQFVRLKVTPD